MSETLDLFLGEMGFQILLSFSFGVSKESLRFQSEGELKKLLAGENCKIMGF